MTAALTENLMLRPRLFRLPASEMSGTNGDHHSSLRWPRPGAIFWETADISRQTTHIDWGLDSALGYRRECWCEPGFWEAHIDPRDRESTLRQFNLAVRETNQFSLEYRAVCADCNTRWFRDSIHVERDERGTPSRLYGLMLDIDSLKSAQLQLVDRLLFEEHLARLSASFINLPPDRIDQEIEKGLEIVATNLGTDRASFGQFDECLAELRITHSWQISGVPPTPTQLLKDAFPWIFKELQQGNKVVISGVEDLPADAEKERQYALDSGQTATLILPFRIGGQLAGGLATACFRRKHSWGPETIQSLQLVAELFANAIVHKKTQEKLAEANLEIESLRDELKHEKLHTCEEIELLHCHGEVIGNSESIGRVLKQVEQVAPTDSSVLLLGETGSGKELLARRVHDLSSRRVRPMVKVNCAALPATLVESELFGRERGAYTGALTREIGRFELANESTLFLDEIGELPLELQSKLLRVLQEGEFERLGSPRTIRVNVRIIAATSRNLNAAVKEGRFREDLFYRLNVFPIHVPPLRERKEDIPALVWHFVRELSGRMGRNIEGVRSSTMADLQRYSWPGNIRELRNVIERSLIIFPGAVFRAEIPVSEEPVTSPTQNNAMEEVVRHHILRTLDGTGWRIRGKKGAAQILGLKPSTLESRIRKLNISRPR